MRLITLLATGLVFLFSPLAASAAGGASSVRAIAFVASHNRGATDPRLAPYEGTLRSNLRFESFRYVGESSASVSPGGKASLALPGGGRVELEADNGGVRVRRGGTIVVVSRGHPAVFMTGSAGKGEASGVIVMAD
jgi:hypothetical protein